ncbi:MAG: ABC transporter ATP-binding protein [Actinomycetota bacterium]|nr:ABC transporter ATP-binding protein [Actinomycetota bacterium]
MKTVRALDLDVALGHVRALAGVSVSLEAGRVAMLVGPNGAGKSTLMKILLGLVRPDGGHVELDDRAISIDNTWKQYIGYLPESVAFSENLSGRQLLRFFANARGVSRARVDEVLGRVGLAEAARRHIRGYSRGMRQRLGLAVAILSEPELLILDEPTAGLDQEGLGVLWSILDEWRSAGRLVLISSHDLALLERRIDDVWVLRAGKVVASGTAEALRDAAALPHRITLTLRDPSGAAAKGLTEAIEGLASARVEAIDDRLICEVQHDAMLELVETQGRFPGTVKSLRVEEPTLDIVYDHLLENA